MARCGGCDHSKPFKVQRSAGAAEMAVTVKDEDHALYGRLLEEAGWGIDFVLRSRFGDGYRATGAAIRRWTDGLIGNMDDCEARVHNHSFENFVMSGRAGIRQPCV